MSLASMFNCAFRAATVAATDVNDIIAKIRDELVNQLPAGSRWTEPVAGTFQSPAYGDGFWFTVTVARVSATRISYQLKDNFGLFITVDTGNIICQDILAAPAVTTVKVFSSPNYLIVDSAGGTVGTPETFACGIMDRYPEDLTKPRACFWCSKGPRTNTGSLSYPQYTSCIVLPVGATAYSSGGSYILDRTPGAGGYYDEISVNGIMRFYPFEFVSGEWFLGRAFNLLMGDGNSMPWGSTVTLPLDDVTTGTFWTTGWNNANPTYNYIKIYVRIA
jgi:hypothetical protein